MTVEDKTQHQHQHQPSTSAVKMVPHPIKGKSNKRPERIEIGDGLVMRWSTKEDAQNVADLLAEAFRWAPMGVEIAEDEDPKPNEYVREAAKRVLRGNSGVMTEYDYALVENTLAPKGRNPLVAAVSLQFSPGYYGKVFLQYGKPEAVAAHPDYRSKGLIRRLFLEMIHPASDQRGDVIQIIPGIPHFYLQFGYEYAIGIRAPRRLDDDAIPPLPDHETVEKGGQGEPFQLRVPGLDDIPYLVKMSTPEKMMDKAELGTLYDEGYWRYNIHDAIVTAESKTDISREHRIIVDSKTGKDCGVVMTNGERMLLLSLFVLEEGYSYREALYPVFRQMVAISMEPTVWELKQQKDNEANEEVERKLEGFKEVMDGSKSIKEAVQDEEQKEQQAEEEKKEEDKEAAPVAQTKKKRTLGLVLDPQHPVTKLMTSRSQAMTFKHKFYTRIPSYAKFIQTIAPTLEERLANSCLAGITVTWQFDFFRKVLGSSGKGLEVVFEGGKIVSASDDWVLPSPQEKMIAARERIAKAKEENRPDVKPLIFEAKFAPLTFTRLLVGDMTIDQMTDVYGECEVSSGDEAVLMLDILFPKQSFYFDLFWW
ncbi:hypothetical protein EMPS_08596 [Entomortierella parvispora]|uniref:N-acetyltransferase domain-containing protein n=1 Tax=Entomortierella parvispora TaxID=205924 RepID=A0A9P3LZL0_9FUNG|nr:hypothetical protein EMPS_08596 [Entomortierella parvispora]